MRLNPEQRHLMVDAVKRGVNKTTVAKVFDTTRKTVWNWCKRAYHRGKESFLNKLRKPKDSKITFEVELFILAIRNTFHWGTARIQQTLRDDLPDFMEEKLEELHVKKPPKTALSRTSINEVLKAHGLNGYRKKYKKWKFFRAKGPNELWQLDIKGPFKVGGKKYYFVICIDDYSRYILLTAQFDHCPTVNEITSLLKPLVKKHKPKAILTDNNPFREEWNDWCKENGIEPLHAHPYYPQDKGKVERAIRSISEEFIYLLRKFPEWLDGKIEQYRKWFNNKRFHRGVNTTPINLYVTL